MKHLMKLESFFRRKKRVEVDPREWTDDEKDFFESREFELQGNFYIKLGDKTKIKVEKIVDRIRTYTSIYYMVTVSYGPAQDKIIKNAEYVSKLGITDYSFLNPVVQSFYTLSELDDFIKLY